MAPKGIFYFGHESQLLISAFSVIEQNLCTRRLAHQADPVGIEAGKQEAVFRSPCGLHSMLPSNNNMAIDDVTRISINARTKRDHGFPMEPAEEWAWSKWYETKSPEDVKK